MNTVSVAGLKASLRDLLRAVRRGAILTVLDCDTPGACIVPFNEDAPLNVRRASRPPSALRLPPPPATPTDSGSVPLEDREKR